MYTFKQFLTERVYQLSNTEQDAVTKIVDNYMRFFDPSRLKMSPTKILSIGPEKVYKEYLNEKGFITMGLIEFHDDRSDTDKTIPVYVGFNKTATDKGTYIYETDKDGNKVDEYILLHYYKIKYNRDFVEDALVHEVNHAKQPYKSIGKNYGRSKLDYYTDPVEVHNYVSNIIKVIENEYLKADKQKRKELLKQLEEFARAGKLSNNELGKIISYVGKDEFVNYLFDNREEKHIRREHQKLVNKLHWLYSQLKDYEER
jgi:hypothetical protein